MAQRRECSFCGKREAEVARLHEGPRALICDECIVLCLEIFAKTKEKPRAKTSSLECSFCGRNQADVVMLVAGPTVFICDGCVARFDGEAPGREGIKST